MPLPDEFGPPESIERPICSNCGWTMWISAIEPHEEPGHHKHIFRCTGCESEEIAIIKKL